MSNSTYRANGTTSAERYLAQLCRTSFLSLWTYPAIYRDQGRAKRQGDGKEVCDLLVVFGNNIVLFSDKDCAFPQTGNLELDWQRWFRKAILKSADQVYGAERWLQEYPDSLYLDRQCTQKFPFPLPNPADARYFRCVVAHGSSQRRGQEQSGSGSLTIRPDTVGTAHLKAQCVPFVVGHTHPSKSYVHVFDDITLEILLNTLDTVADFVAYLDKKEELISAGRLYTAQEEDLLGLYLSDVNEREEHDFPNAPQPLKMLEGSWERFCSAPERSRQGEADKISYFWDALIERFSEGVLDGTSYFQSHPNLSGVEKGIRCLAAESRFHRRMLSEAFLEICEMSVAHLRATRLVPPMRAEDPFYVFLLLPEHPRGTPDQNRAFRRRYLEGCCYVVRLFYPTAAKIVGIASEAGHPEWRSEDLAYFDETMWTAEIEAFAREFQEKTSVFNELRISCRRVKEYPLLV